MRMMFACSVAMLALCPPVFATPAESTPVAAPRVLLLPPQIQVFELGAATLEKDPEWSETATRNVRTVAADVLQRNGKFEVVALPELSVEEQRTVAEHAALLDAVSGTALQNRALGGVWAARLATWDYGIGSGLAFLRERTGVEHALVLFGVDTQVTGGRVAMGILIAGVTGAGIGMGGTTVVAGLIELETGRITWLNSYLGQGDLRLSSDAAGFVDRATHPYPIGSVSGGGRLPYYPMSRFAEVKRAFAGGE